MDRDTRHCTGSSDQDHSQEKEHKWQNGYLRRPYKQLRKEASEREGRRRKRGKEKGKGDFFLHNILSLR